MIDQVISGRYKVEYQIGSGGMGIVYRALDTKLRRSVALKVIAPHLVEDEEARTRFLHEAQALASLSHPNIVTVFDLAEEAETGKVFIVMELLNGLQLRKRITDPGRPPFFDMSIQVCRALEHAHGHGVLHRDIKPENIFVCMDGTVKLMDFGLARLVDSATVNASGMFAGTVAYMSPEQLRGTIVDARADLYALGVLFYEYLSGFTPFTSDNSGTMLLKHLTESPPPLRDKVPGVSPEVEALILVLLAKEPDNRYPSATLLRDSLERIRARGTAAATVVTAPMLAGPAMHAVRVPVVAAKDSSSSLIPLAAPRPQRPRQMTSSIRGAGGRSRGHAAGRWAAVFGVILLGGALAFAFGENFQRMLFPPSDPAKKAALVKGASPVKAKQTLSPHPKRPRKNRRAHHAEPADGVTAQDPATEAKPSAKPGEDAPSEGIDASDPGSGGAGNVTDASDTST